MQEMQELQLCEEGHILYTLEKYSFRMACVVYHIELGGNLNLWPCSIGLNWAPLLLAANCGYWQSLR